MFVLQTFKKLMDVFGFWFICPHAGINLVIMLDVCLKPFQTAASVTAKVEQIGALSLPAETPKLGRTCGFCQALREAARALRLGPADPRCRRTCRA